MKVPSGYRPVTPHERIQEGDLYWSEEDSLWVETKFAGTLATTHEYIRRIPGTAEPPIGYEILPEQATIEPDDLFWSEALQIWEPTMSVGLKIDGTLMYARKIDNEEFEPEFRNDPRWGDW